MVVIVIGDEIFDGVVGEELLELGSKLGGQSLVVSHHDGGPLNFLNDVGHGEGLTATGNAQHGLVDGPFSHPLRQPGHRLGLISGHLEISDQFEALVLRAGAGGPDVFNLFSGVGPLFRTSSFSH